MSRNNPRAPRQAILVMDSRLASVNVRSQNYSGAWSQLYKADDFYLDLGCKPEGGAAVLMGKVVGAAGTPAPALVALWSGDQVLKETPLSEAGTFRMSVERAGTYCLEFTFGGVGFSTQPLEIL